MENLIPSLALLGYCFSLRRLTKLPIEAIPFFIVATVIVFLYFATYIDILKIAGLGLLLMGHLLLLSSIIYLAQNRELIFSDYITPGLTIIIFYIVIFGIMAHHIASIVEGDDVVRWMPHAKFLYLKKMFLTKEDTTCNLDYPPGGALFYYFFIQINGYNEGNLFFAQVFLILTPLTILLRSIKWSNFISALLFFSIILFILIHTFKVELNGRQTLLMDNPIAMFFAGALASYILLAKEYRISFYLLPPLMALVLFKPMQYPFIMMIVLAVFADQVLANHNKEKKAALWLCLGLLIPPALIIKSWDYYLQKITINSTWSIMRLFHSVINQRTHLTAEQIHKVFLLYSHGALRSALFAMLMLMTVGLICHNIKNIAIKSRIWIVHIVMLLGYSAYSLVILLFYLFQMSSIIATNLSSYQRFMHTYEIAWFILLMANLRYFYVPVIAYFRNIPRIISYSSAFIFLTLVLSNSIHEIKLNDHCFKEKKGWQYMAHESKNIANSILALTGPNAKIVIIGSNRIPLIPLFAYELIPASTFSYYEYISGKIAFEERLKASDYLLLVNVNNYFWDKFGKYFNKLSDQPFAELEFCSNPFSKQYIKSYRNSNCKLQQTPIYLYKVIVKNNKLYFKNLLEKASYV